MTSKYPHYQRYIVALFWRHAWAAMQEVLWEDGKHVRFDATASLQAGHTFPDCKHMRFDASKQASRSHISADTCASILGEGHASQKRLLPFSQLKGWRKGLEFWTGVTCQCRLKQKEHDFGSTWNDALGQNWTAAARKGKLNCISAKIGQLTLQATVGLLPVKWFWTEKISTL